MKESNSIEQKLWQIPMKVNSTKEDFSEIIIFLISKLSDYLQQQIEIIDKTIEESIVDEESFCCCIRSARSLGGPLTIAWEGRLGMEPIEGKACVSASLFLFSQNNRLAVTGQESSYLELVYEPSDNSEGRWRSQGWLEDVYGEFESINQYSGQLPS
ncbi:hypothetical protein MC7420_2892 [Coleofasciculus chthonoplastes PCC 7420]|uniref:Uncharacterized protein n=1 Tax=Coleofasciculus chthonoplastes PCC 7420 TaxID=118168 RepID=B4VJR7_9CYAN|nr:hypothetical protein [Coleofasciculus chthonoplastes]EDX77568.1 hypothetical protein MC7420_2892 [Coleofasciculus chthonoplastes PCC 7420]